MASEINTFNGDFGGWSDGLAWRGEERDETGVVPRIWGELKAKAEQPVREHWDV